VQKGFKVVKMGFSEERQNSSEDSKCIFIEPSKDKEFRPWIEAYIFKHCAFCVGMMTGGTLYASFFNRPVLWTDIFWRGTPVGKKTDMIVPKLILRGEEDEREKSILSLLEIRKLGPPPDNNWNNFARLGLKVKNCSRDELSNAVLDMIAFLKTGKYFQLKQDRENHKKFSAIHYKKVKRTINTPTRLAPSWAKKYSKLISPGKPLESRQFVYNKFWQRQSNDEYLFNKTFDVKKTSSLFLKAKRNFKKT
jgi:putative glycosyltransferase (TIGR04372 family)